MTPAASVPGVAQATLLISLICLSTLLTWLMRLAINPESRQWLRAHPRLAPLAMAVLAACGAIFPSQHLGPWLAAQREARDAEARRAVLGQARTLAGIAMPAGTVLTLATPDDYATFLRAEFPQVVEIAGLKARQLWRHPAQGNDPESWSLTLSEPQTLDGWTCTPGHLLELRLQHGNPLFEGCHLATGNTLEAQPLPAGTWVARLPGQTGWRLRTEGSEALLVDKLPLLRADVQLNSARRVTTFEGLLAQDLILGPMSYPTGTRAAHAGNVPQAQPGDLLFSPARGRSAQRKDGEDVGPGSSVLQAPDGTVRAVLSNREAGVLDVADFRVGP